MHCFEGLTRESVQVLQTTWPQGFMTAHEVLTMSLLKRTSCDNNVRNIRVLFENVFLQDGHIGFGGSLICFFSLLEEVSESAPAGVDGVDGEGLAVGDLSNTNLTAIRFFLLQT